MISGQVMSDKSGQVTSDRSGHVRYSSFTATKHNLITKLLSLIFFSMQEIVYNWRDYLSSRTYSRHICAWLLKPACRMPDHNSRAFEMLPQNFACQSNQTPVPDCHIHQQLQSKNGLRDTLLLLLLTVFTCVSYAEARNRYRLDVCPSVTRLNILSCFLRHTIAHSF